MRAFRDGHALEPDDARELWGHFSAWMDDHPGDLAGFAAALGVTSVRPALDAGGAAVLVVSTTEAQTAYGNASRIGPAPAKRNEKPKPPSPTKAPTQAHAPPRGKREKGAAHPKPVQGNSKGKPGSAAPKAKAPKQPR